MLVMQLILEAPKVTVGVSSCFFLPPCQNIFHFNFFLQCRYVLYFAIKVVIKQLLNGAHFSSFSFGRSLLCFS